MIVRRFLARRRNLLGLALAAGLSAIALFADFIASDRPILLRRAGTLYLFANVVEYSGLRGVDLTRTGPGDWALWPPVRQGPYRIPALAEAGPLPEPPGPAHPLGTDNAGRDTLARLVHGTRLSLGVGVAAVLVQVLIGLVLGVLAGYLGGWVDFAVSRSAEVLLSFPLLLLLLAVQGVLERTTLFSTMAVIGLTRWADTARMVRAEALRVRELPFVTASHASGSSRLRTLVRHVLPNCLAPALVAATFAVGSAILLESALSFLGFGAPEPTASWGLLMADGFQDILDPAARPLVLLPGLAIFVAVAAFDLLGDGLREALDPRAQEVADSSAPTAPHTRGASSKAPMDERHFGGRTHGSLLSVRDLRVRFGRGPTAFAAIDGISFDLQAGDALGLIGESGSGKSTTALSLPHLLSRAARASGSVKLLDEELLGADETRLREVRGRRIAMVFHDPLAALNPVLRAGEQVAEALRFHARLPRKAARSGAVELLLGMGLPALAADLFPHQLSGGMRQRVLIAAALACGPALLVADEPTSALDPVAERQIVALLQRLRQERHVALLLATHDVALAAKLCDRIAILYAGRIVERGSVSEVLARPRHPYTAGLLRSLPPRLGEPRTSRLEPVPGSAPLPWARPSGCRFRDRCPRAQPDCESREPELADLGGTETACFHPLETA
jgi:oligopeptide/dipeptide ABC transporter ATP-binding protein